MDNKQDKAEEDDGNIIDVEAEEEKPQPVDNTDGTDKATSSNSKPLPLILAIAAIVIVAAGWGLGYQYWQNLAVELAGMQARISSTYAEQEKLNQQIEDTRRLLDEQQTKLEQQQAIVDRQNQAIADEKADISRQTEAMQQAVEKVTDKLGRTDNQWQIAEAAYLLRIANHRLTLGKDVTTAIAALQQADSRLHDSGDLGLVGVREKLAQEIEQLKALNMPDVVGIAANLQALSAQVGQLKLAGESQRIRDQNHAASQSSDSERNLDTILEDSWRGFQDLMVIRKHDKPVTAMLPPQQQFFLFQNLQLQLESARLALLRQESILFKSSLDTAIEWLNAFFDSTDANTQNMLETLRGLQTHSFDAQLPDISGSLTLLLQQRKESN